MKATKQNFFDKKTLDLCANADGVLRFDEKGFSDSILIIAVIEKTVQLLLKLIILLNLVVK